MAKPGGVGAPELEAEESEPDGSHADCPEAERLAQLLSPQLHSFGCYLLLCCLGVGGVASLAVALWSGIVLGDQTFRALGDGAGYRPLFLGACALLLAHLYLLDFFWPPHLPGQLLALWEGDRSSRHLLLGVVASLLIASCLVSAKEQPAWPLLANIALCPLCIVALRFSLRQPRSKEEELGERIAQHGDRAAKAELLQVLTNREEDQMRFLWAALLAFFLSAAGTFLAWLHCSEPSRSDLLWQRDAPHGGPEESMAYLRAVAPLAVAVSNFVFGLLILLRITMQRRYAATDSCRALLLAAQAVDRVGVWSEEAQELSRRLCSEQRDREAKQLGASLRLMSIVFAILIGTLYAAGQILYEDSVISSFIGGLLLIFLIAFLGFIYMAFRRVVFGQWLSSRGARRVVEMAQGSSWAHALCIFLALPLLPVVLALSALNQWVRLCRDLDARHGPEEAKGEGGALTLVMRSLLTPRVETALQATRKWKWIVVWTRCYILCGIYTCYTLFPLLLNVSLSCMNAALERWPFWAVVSAVFVVGALAFLLPPVPGMTVYIFGGMAISGAAQVTDTVDFWSGTLINIAVCWCLKLFACAVQQKCIGELLGKSLWVRKTVGVHKAHIRCIEAILREPGMSVGKVSILCGGPDWPTSVLAGVLKLPLLQCELGTMPIIFFVAPCALSGSFYLKRNASEIWNRSASLMMLLSVAVNLLLWMLAAWAIQRQLELHHEELRTPRPENADLEWLDYRAARLEEASNISWGRVPTAVRWALALCAGLQILICQIFFSCYSCLFGDFQVDDDIALLGWYPTDDEKRKYIFTGRGAAVVLALFAAAWLGPLLFWSWHWWATRTNREKAALELGAFELGWKEQWISKACKSVSFRSGSKELTNQAAEDVTRIASELALKTQLTRDNVLSRGLSGISLPTSTSSVPRDNLHCLGPSHSR